MDHLRDFALDLVTCQLTEETREPLASEKLASSLIDFVLVTGTGISQPKGILSKHAAEATTSTEFLVCPLKLSELKRSTCLHGGSSVCVKLMLSVLTRSLCTDRIANRGRSKPYSWEAFILKNHQRIPLKSPSTKLSLRNGSRVSFTITSENFRALHESVFTVE